MPASLYTYPEILTVIGNGACCLATKNHQRILAEQNGEESDCLLNEAFRLMNYLDVLTRFVPGGTQVGLMVDASADIDMTGTVVVPAMSGVISITYSGGTVVIGTFSGTTFTTISELIDAIIAGLQGGWTGVNNDPIITITAPTNLGFNPLSGVITITLAPFFEKDTGVETATEPRGSCTVNNPFSPMYGYTFIANYNTDTVGVWNYNVFVTNIVLPGGSQPNGCCYDPVNDRIYVPCVGTANTHRIDNTLTLLTPLATGAVGVGCVYNSFNNCKYVTIQGSNQVVKLDNADTMTVIGGFNSPYIIEVNTYNGEIWVGSSAINRLYIIDPTTNIITQQIDTAITTTGRISFYPAANAATGRMFISNFTSNSIEEWDLTGTVVNTAFIVTITPPTNVFYSTLFDRIFVGHGNGLAAYYVSGLPDTVPITQGTPSPHNSPEFRDDYAHEALTRTVNPAGTDDDLEFYKLDAPQIEVSGEFEGTVTPVLHAAAANCIDNPDIIISNILKICGCCDRGSSTTSTEELIQVLRGSDPSIALDANGQMIIIN